MSEPANVEFLYEWVTIISSKPEALSWSATHVKFMFVDDSNAVHEAFVTRDVSGGITITSLPVVD